MTVGNQAQSDEKNVKSIEKALNILLLFTPETPELSHTDIAKTMGWSTATTSRLLNTLQNKGFLIRDPSTGRYTLGGVLYFLGQIAKKSADLGQICTPILERIRDETKETAHIFIREGIERVCFAQAEGTQSIRQSTKLGTHEPLCYGATGIVLLAFQKPEELGQSLAAMKDYCKDVNLQQLLMKIAITKDQGYCLKKGDSDGTHVGCIAAPIYNADGSVTSCLGISTHEFRFPDDPSYFVSLIKQGAKEISQQLGYHGDLE